MGQAISWAWANPRLFLELFLVAAILVAGWMYNRKLAQIDDLRSDMGELAADLKERVTIMDGQVEIVKRIGGKVTVQKIYMPKEGGTTIEVSSATGKVIYKYDTKGFTFKPGGGVEWGGAGIQPYIDAKWAYWDRYSALAGGSIKGVGLGVSRHLDDILWGKPQNIELFLNYKLIRANDALPVVVGVRTNF